VGGAGKIPSRRKPDRGLPPPIDPRGNGTRRWRAVRAAAGGRVRRRPRGCLRHSQSSCQRPEDGAAGRRRAQGGRWRRERSFPAEAGKGSYRPPFEPPDATDEDCCRHFEASRAGTAPRPLWKMAGHLATSCPGRYPTDTGRQCTADTGVSAVCFWCGRECDGRGRCSRRARHTEGGQACALGAVPALHFGPGRQVESDAEEEGELRRWMW